LIVCGWLLLVVSSASFAGSRKEPPSADLPAASSQALVVSAATSASSAGSLALFERNEKSGRWCQLGNPIPVSLGRNGLALAKEKSAPAGIPLKIEGDGKTPIGTFPLERVFGRHGAFATKLPYLALARTTEAVDDPASRYYNRIVDRHDVGKPDWKSSEKMFRDDSLYDLGVVVGYNTQPVQPGKGSCIFLHIWRAPGSPTSGCVAMARPDLERIVGWLDPAARPVIDVRMIRGNAY